MLPRRQEHGHEPSPFLPTRSAGRVEERHVTLFDVGAADGGEEIRRSCPIPLHHRFQRRSPSPSLDGEERRGPLNTPITHSDESYIVRSTSPTFGKPPRSAERPVRKPCVNQCIYPGP